MHFATVLLHHASSDSAGRPPAALRRTVTSSCHMQNLQTPAAEQLLRFVRRNERRCRVVLLNTNVTPQAPQRAYTAVDFRAACEPVPFSKTKYSRAIFWRSTALLPGFLRLSLPPTTHSDFFRYWIPAFLLRIIVYCSARCHGGARSGRPRGR